MKNITKEQYMLVQHQLAAFALIVREMPLAEFLAAIERADAFGPVIDPTLWKLGHEKMDVIKKMAEGLFAFQGSLPPVCARCRVEPLAYPGAVYCGAACSAKAEAHQ